MADGWSNRRNAPIVNFLAYSPRGTVFLKSKEAVAEKNGSHAAAAAKKGKDDSISYDSSEDESSDDEEIPAKASAPKNVPAQPVTIKRTEVSEDSKSDSDSDESSSEGEGKTKSATVSKVIPKKSEEDDSSESDSDEDETPAPKAASAVETKPKANAQKESSSEEESSSDSSDDEEDSEDEKPVKTPKKNGTDVEMADADVKSNVKTPKMPVTPVTHENTGSKTLFVGNLFFQVEHAEIEKEKHTEVAVTDLVAGKNQNKKTGTWSDEKGSDGRRKGSHGEDTVREERHVAPAHYSMKIDSFSLLSEMVDNSYESREFEASGYKWKLVLYPNGDKSRNGDGYISLYLVMADTTVFSPGWEINAIFKLFVHDQLQDKYLTIGDGRLKRFSAINNKWGFPQMLSLSIFNKASNGYLIGDSCVFGVEVFVIKNEGKGEHFSMIKDPSDGTFTWEVQKFSELTKEFYCSRVYLAGRHQ
ncbi:hypothetical protein DKX38_026674 [Salix brachista]|uniref:MATH domain-containing protein n=1 Tax=Salix brachista TaxID=2182728 RepID=A0A5N5JC05_9ROSI|nr:hypothetical protein DKX38_026674 [Salix brachista]